MLLGVGSSGCQPAGTRTRTPCAETTRRSPVAAAATAQAKPARATAIHRIPRDTAVRPREVLCLDTGRWAEIHEHAVIAARAPRVAHAAAVPDQQMRQSRPIRPRHDLPQVPLDLHLALRACPPH